jgi:uncharacterized iron-regulated protein
MIHGQQNFKLILFSLHEQNFTYTYKYHFTNVPITSTVRQIPNFIYSIQALQHCNNSSSYKSLDRLWGLQEFGAPRIYKQSVHAVRKFVGILHWPPLTREMDLVLVSVKVRVGAVG